MTLSDVLKKFDNRDFPVIEYRSIASIGSNDADVWCGMASYKNKMLTSLDGDSYHLNDEIKKYELFREDWLVVWYDGMWKRGK